MAPNIITLMDPRSAAAEAYRALRTNLLFSALERALPTLLITTPSAATADAKSECAANLAVTLAQSDRSVLLVDCDLRQPRQHVLWGLAADRGLSSALADGGALPVCEVNVPNLKVLPAGPHPDNPADLLGSRKMEALLLTMQQQAEIVIFDAPPVLVVTDAVLLASKLAGALLVLSAGHTRRDDAERASDLLQKGRIHILGAVLANAEDSGQRTY